MATDNKVVWSEGMFLRTQHFQQFDRYMERLVRGAAGPLRPYGWGITELQINREMLSTGKFAVSHCRGILEDGTPFAIPELADHPPPLTLPEQTRNCVVYLTAPVQQPGGIEFDMAGKEETTARFAIEEYEAHDANAGSETVAPLQIGRMRLRFGLETEELAGYSCLGLARVIEVRADKNVVLDEGFIPPTLDSAASPVLSGFIAELQGLIHHRGEALGARVAESGTKGVAEIADFLLLQAVNRYEPVLSHILHADKVHPEAFYGFAVAMAGEMATFVAERKRPPAFPAYKHDDLQRTFQPVMRELRHFLSAVLEQTAIPIPLEERKYGIRVAKIADRSLLASASFVLSVKAEKQAEQLRRLFPTEVTIGPVEKIRELVNSAVPGIRLRALPVAPRQIAYHPGVIYFELERASPFWRELQSSGGLAIHVAGDYPNLQLELWAIKG
ncbi:MAG: type VI secretion system baseplate subunit TssK [Alphaproteobacteria bacterium]|jgi:type VI secretion system protein ImpJ|nr:type VI secretion system baseplate subunit TssK [Alphaproteobacteria bacterium]